MSTRNTKPRSANRRTHSARRRIGFTLVEIILAIGLSTIIMGAAAVFVFSSFNLLTSAQNDPGLDHHKLGVTSFVKYAFDQALPDSAIPISPLASNTSSGNTTGNTTGGAAAGSPVTGSVGGSNTTTSRSGAILAQTETSYNPNDSGNTSGNTTGGNATAGNDTSDDGNDTTAEATSPVKTSLVVWGWPPGVQPDEHPYLSFVLPSDNPIAVWDQGPRPPVRCFLSFKEGEGLELIWVPPYSPNDDEINAVRRTMLSPLVTAMNFMYYDPTGKSWTTTDTAPIDQTTGNFFLPDFVRLTFNLNGKTSNMTIQLPPGQNTMPLY